MSDIKKLFVFVNTSDCDAFKTAHLNNTTDSYASKISFLAKTGEIMTRGQVFALNRESEISALQTILGSSLEGTAASSLSAGNVITFIQKVYEATQTNAGNITTNANDIDALETRVGMTDASGLSKRIKDNEDAITLLNKTDGTAGSVKKTVDDAIAALVANAPTAFDTLKEIADWIQADSQNSSGFDAANRITTLETKVGTVSTTYTAEEANEYNTSHNLKEGDSGYKTAGDSKSDSTGIYHDIESIHNELDTMTGSTGSIQTQITNNINALDSSVTLAGTTGSQPASVTTNTYIDVLGSITISETDGMIDVEATGKSAKVVLQADAAGAAQATYNAIVGNSNDPTSALSLYGVKAYAADLVSNKNVTAEGDNTLINATASGNKVSVSATNDLTTAVSHANTAIQSVILTSANTTYLTITNTSGAGDGTAASGTFTPMIGVTPTITGIEATAGTNGLATTNQLAYVVNALDFWENYTAPAQNP